MRVEKRFDFNLPGEFDAVCRVRLWRVAAYGQEPYYRSHCDGETPYTVLRHARRVTGESLDATASGDSVTLDGLTLMALIESLRPQGTEA